MAERAAHLVDHVFPPVFVRQWVFTLPPRLRYVVAWDHALCRAVLGVFIRAVLGFLRRRARARQDVADGRSGAVAIIQRFGAALNLNVRCHACLIDGVFAENGAGGLRFHAAPPRTDEDMDQVLGTVARRIHRLLARRERVLPGEVYSTAWRAVSGRQGLGRKPLQDVQDLDMFRRTGNHPAYGSSSVLAQGPTPLVCTVV
jgi:hypothetical protein